MKHDRTGLISGIGGPAVAVVALYALREQLAGIGRAIAGDHGWLYVLLVLVWGVALALLCVVGMSNVFRIPVVGKPLKILTNYAMLLVLGAFLFAPFAWMILVSLHRQKSPIPDVDNLIPRREARLNPVTHREIKFEDEANPPKTVRIAFPSGVTDVPVSALPTKVVTDFHPENFSFVLFNQRLPVGRFFLNSVVVTFSTVIFQLLFSSLAAYGFARLKFKGREVVFALFLGSMMFAGTVTTIPVYLMIRSLGWLNTYWALIVPGVSSAFTVFLMRQFFLQVPIELDEAAKLDGAGDLRIYWHVMLPLSRAALATAAAFTFFGVWTDFFNPMIYTNSTDMRTLEVGLSIFKNSYGTQNWPLQMTAAIIVMAPLLLVFLFTQRYFTRGIMLGSIK